MKKEILFILLIGIIILSVKAQYEYPKGIYLTPIFLTIGLLAI